MTNTELVGFITVNVAHALEKKGIRFGVGVGVDDAASGASVTPRGAVNYKGEAFEDAFGARPLYADCFFDVIVAFRSRSGEEGSVEARTWTHAMREAISVDALNTGGLGADKPVSKAIISRVDVRDTDGVTEVRGALCVRYREVSA